MNKLTQIFSVPSDLISGSMCLDNYGNYILPGRRFQPISSDHCTQCVCINSKPSQCLTIKCQPPDNCKKSAILQKKGSCCEFICLNPDEEEDSPVERSNKLALTINKPSPSIKEYSESKNTIDHHMNRLNDLEMNGNKESVRAVQKNNNLQDTSLLSSNNAIQQANQNLIKSNTTLNTQTDRRYSNLENTLKKLISNKNDFKVHEEATIKLNSSLNDRRQVNPAFQNLGLGVGIGNRDSTEEIESNSQFKQNKPQRINYSTNYHQTIYSPPRNKYSISLNNNEQIKSDAGKKYGIHGVNIYHNNLGNGNAGYNYNHNSSQNSDEYPYLTLNHDFIRTKQFNRNYVHNSNGINLSNNGSNLWFSAQNLGLRLIASTVCTFLILALLFFLIHRLRQRRLMAIIRRLQNRRESNGQHTHGLPCFQNDLGRSCFIEAPPSYSSMNSSLYPGFWKPICNTNNLVPGEAPPPYSLVDEININQAPSFSNPLLNINSTDATESTNNQLTCFNTTTSNLLGNGNCFNAIDSRFENVQTNLNGNNSVNIRSDTNYEVPFVANNHQTTTLKTNQSLVRTNQPTTHFDLNGTLNGVLNGGRTSRTNSNRNSLHKFSKLKLSKHLAKQNQFDKLRSLNDQQSLSARARTLIKNELVETQNLNNSIIEDQMFKANESVCRLFINNNNQENEGQISNQISSQIRDQLNVQTSSQMHSQLSNQNSNYQISSQNKYQTNHSQSVDNLTNKSISNRLLDFYNNNLSNQQQAFSNQTYLSIGKINKTRYNSNLSLKNNQKYQRCVVNIPSLQPVFKSAQSSNLSNQNAFKNHLEQLNNQTDSQFDKKFDDQFDNNFDDNESLEEIPSPAPLPPERKVSLPIELGNDEHDEHNFTNYLKNHQSSNQFFFNESTDFKNQTKCLSFNHSTPTINNLSQFRYSLYLNKLKENEYQKQLEQNKLEQEQTMSQSSTNESLIKSLNALSNSSSLRSFNQSIKNMDDLKNENLIDQAKFDDSITFDNPINPINRNLTSENSSKIDNDQDEMRPSTSASTNTTRIMINYKKS